MSSTSSIPLTKLPNGTQIPMLGFGTGTTWFKRDPSSPLNLDLVTVIKAAIAAGYRLLDAGEDYGTEAELGQAIKESGVPRDELFVITKVARTLSEGTPEDVTVALENSLRRLQVEYVDLYILHSPYCTNKDYTYDEAAVAQAWKVLESLAHSGKARTIGISNFRKHHVENLLKTAEIKPVLNQIQFHPYFQGAPEYAQWLGSKGIMVQGWMGLAPITHLRGRNSEGEGVLEEVAEKYGISRSAVLIRWQLDQGGLVLNTTKKVERVQEFLAALELELSKEDRDRITRAGQETHVCVPIGNRYDGGDYGPYL